jgi:hypothetical protein
MAPFATRVQLAEAAWPGETHLLFRDRKKLVNPRDGSTLIKEEN